MGMIVCKWQNINQLIPIPTESFHCFCVHLIHPFACKQTSFMCQFCTFKINVTGFFFLGRQKMVKIK